LNLDILQVTLQRQKPSVVLLFQNSLLAGWGVLSAYSTRLDSHLPQKRRRTHGDLKNSSTKWMVFFAPFALGRTSNQIWLLVTQGSDRRFSYASFTTVPL